MAVKADAFRKLAADYAEAWSPGSPEAVASFYSEDGQIVINGGEPSKGREAIAGMAAGFYAEFPDLVVKCDNARLAGGHAVFVWTLQAITPARRIS